MYSLIFDCFLFSLAVLTVLFCCHFSYTDVLSLLLNLIFNFTEQLFSLFFKNPWQNTQKDHTDYHSHDPAGHHHNTCSHFRSS